MLQSFPRYFDGLAIVNVTISTKKTCSGYLHKSFVQVLKARLFAQKEYMCILVLK